MKIVLISAGQGQPHAVHVDIFSPWLFLTLLLYDHRAIGSDDKPSQAKLLGRCKAAKADIRRGSPVARGGWREHHAEVRSNGALATHHALRAAPFTSLAGACLAIGAEVFNLPPAADRARKE